VYKYKFGDLEIYVYSKDVKGFFGHKILISFFCVKNKQLLYLFHIKIAFFCLCIKKNNIAFFTICLCITKCCAICIFILNKNFYLSLIPQFL